MVSCISLSFLPSLDNILILSVSNDFKLDTFRFTLVRDPLPPVGQTKLLLGMELFQCKFIGDFRSLESVMASGQ